MKKVLKHKTSPAGMNQCLTAASALLIVIIALAALDFFFEFPALKMLILLILQPLGISILLMIEMENRNVEEAINETAETELSGKLAGLRRVLRKISGWIKHICFVVKRFYFSKRVLIVHILCAVFVIACNYFFWFLKISEAELNPVLPVAFAGLFLLMLIMDIWGRHARKCPEDNGKYFVLLENLRNTAQIGKILFLAAAAVSVLPLIGMWNLHSAFFYTLKALFAIQTVGIIFFYTVRTIKQEINTNPDLSFRFSGRKKGDLDLLYYLENNTGITMRSLWSISFMKHISPYVILLGVAFLWLSTGIVQIGANEHGALYRLGRLRPESLEPGIHLTLPWPFDTVSVYDTESLKEITVGYEVGETSGDNLWTETHGGEESKLLLGGGNELVSINLRLEYKISDLSSYLRCSNAPEKLLESAAYEIITANTISTNLETLLDVDRMAFSKSFKKDLVERISHYDTGLEVADVVIESIHPPVEVAEVYQRIISAGIEAEKIILNSEAWAEVTVERARTSHDTHINEARVKSYESIADAKASVAEFMAGVNADMIFGNNYRYYKYLNSIEKAYSEAKLIIVGDGIDGSALYFGKLPAQEVRK